MRAAVLSLVRLPVELFYRHFSLGGAIPDEGPVVLVANHPNGLVDPLLVQSRTPRPLHFLAKEPLFRMPLVGSLVRAFGALPVYRAQDGADTEQNQRTFAAVFDALERGEAVCLFPEGISHSEPTLQKLKTGAARMALGAEARANFTLGVRIVPVGLVYADKTRMRSKLATWVGRPIEVRDLAPTFAEDERAATVELTARVADGLERVTLNLDRWEDLPLLELVEQIWRPGEGRRVERLRTLANGLRALRAQDPQHLAELEKRATSFAGALGRFGLSPGDLELQYGPWTVVRFAARNALELLLLPIALVGILFWALPYLVVDLIARAGRPSADLTATVKILAAMVLAPLWWMGTAYFVQARWGTPIALAGLITTPPAGWIGLRLTERLSTARESAAVFLKRASAPSLEQRLRARRDELAAEVERAATALVGDPGAATDDA